jgi:hypothetical protein
VKLNIDKISTKMFIINNNYKVYDACMHKSYTVRQRPRSIFGLQNVFLHQYADFISQSIVGTNIQFELLVFYCLLIIVILYCIWF